ncbi:hypothetical protein [Rhizobium sp. FY34]|uniref:hypothetical protein n=1 Tax=Rhizobium sp. FY34 TaxID=2562309 RepID=UPI0010C0BA0F|nr:hypothetical protein [Rhizobium sp. FY34]
MTATLSRYLKDFSAPPAMPAALSHDDFSSSFSFDDVVPEEPVVDVEAIRAEAYAQGMQAGEETIRAQWEEDRQKLEARHAEALADLRQRLEQDAGRRIEEGLRAAVDTISAAVADQAALVLAPVMEEVLAERAVRDMAEMIKETLSEHKAACLTVRGPVALFDILKEALGPEAPELRHVETPDLDISVDIDEAVLVTRMSAWAGSLKKVLG